MLARNLSVCDVNSYLWGPLRALFEAAQALEQHDDTYRWHGWRRSSIEAFLQGLPPHCALVFAVWGMLQDGREELYLGGVLEVRSGEVQSLRTLDTFADASLPAMHLLEPGIEHASMLLRLVAADVAPVVWALFTDRATWDLWVLGASEEEVVDKGALLESLSQQGSCVLLGSRATHHR